MNVKKSLSDLTLIALENSIDGYVILQDFTYNTHKYISGYPRLINKHSLSKSLKRLREKGLVDFIKEEELMLKLTDKGREQAVWVGAKLTDKKWDGIWRLVIFDIPESKRGVRDLLRSTLKQWGFVHWQQSVWASKKNCTEPLRKFIKQVGIESWVMVIESNNVVRSQKN